MSLKLPVPRHTDEELEAVKTKSQLIGIMQGAGGVIAAVIGGVVGVDRASGFIASSLVFIVAGDKQQGEQS